MLSTVLIALFVVGTNYVRCQGQGGNFFLPPLNQSVSASAASQKISCMTCVRLGSECQSIDSESNCDFCAKLVGTVEKPEDVPRWVRDKLIEIYPNENLESFKGKQLVVRLCVPISTLLLLNIEQTVHCESSTNFFGFSGSGCLCKADCGF